MIKARRMRRAGLVRIENAKKSGAWDRAEEPERTTRVLPELKKALAANKAAEGNFDNLAPFYRRQYIGWFLGARREETRSRRL